MTKVISLHQHRPEAGDVVKALRDIADCIEEGEVSFPITTAVVVLGHTGSEVQMDDGTGCETFWRTFGAGSRRDSFTIRGLLLTAANRWEGR